MNPIRKGLAVAVIVLFIGMSVSSTGINIQKSTTSFDGNILYVGGDGPGNYSTIESAVQDADDGDTVFVYNGTYIEYITVDKSLNLIGEDRNTTIIDGNGDRDVIKIYAYGATIKGFTIRNSGTYAYDAGIMIYTAYNKVCENIIEHNNNGILLESNSSKNNNIENNTIIENNKDGICLRWAKNNKIFYNLILLNDDGITIYNGNNNTIINNAIIKNHRLGICLSTKCKKNAILYNNISNNNLKGIQISHFSDDNLIKENSICYNYDNGIEVSMYNDNITILENTISYNNKGIDFRATTNSSILRNKIIDNHLGVDLALSLNNSVLENDLINNNVNAFFICDNPLKMHNKRNIWNGNYWSNSLTKGMTPKLILGQAFITINITFKWFNIDWHPAKEPYDI